MLRLGEEQCKAAAQPLVPKCPSLAGPAISCSKVFTTSCTVSCRSMLQLVVLPPCHPSS